MSAVVIDGKKISEEVKADVAQKVISLKEKGITPCLSVILVGNNPASVSYVAGKRKALQESGMEDRSIQLPETTSEAELLSIIDRLNKDASVHGILVQLPLPSHINEKNIINAISVQKDVDGFNPVNIGKLFTGEKGFVPCTPQGIAFLLKKMNIRTQGANAVIVGRSNIVGKPMALLLMNKEYNCTVTVCHTGTVNLKDYTTQADILIVASGKINTVTRDMVKEGACVIDVGVNRISDASKKSGFRLCGDVDFDNVKEVAGYITPVPKGVGPMTIAMLIRNTLEAAENTLK